MKRSILYILILLSGLFELKAQETTTLLHSRWSFRKVGTTSWYPATVPGNVFTDLYKNKLIEDPFYSDNEKKLQWVEKESWEYSCAFNCDTSLLNRKHVELFFEGLDTYANVYVNDSLALKADNMFRSWTADVKHLLKKGTNAVHVIFESAVERGKAEAAKLPYTLPEGERVFTRKAQFQYGWDFGPRYAGCGIWKSVSIKTWDDFRIENLKHENLFQTDSFTILLFTLKTFSTKEGEFEMQLKELSDKKGTLLQRTKKIHLKKGRNTDTLELKIVNPKLWWCNRLGEPYQYTFECSVKQNKLLKEKKRLKLGIRKIDWQYQPDSLGNTFCFKVNGIPVFMKGANYIPSDIFLKQKSKLDYDKEIEGYKSSGMNMLRVWGGGVYGDDAFYEACDEKGVLVWQDLMFACAMYPGDSNFIANVKAEVKDQMIRLRNHPSLALWCGNNENLEGWDNWGWQKQFGYSKADSAKIRKDYEHLFQDQIPGVINENNTNTYYLSTSPFVGWGHPEGLAFGDSHYWGVWWGMEPFSNYEKRIGRFMTEYGFQSMPDLETFKTFCPNNELQMGSKSIAAHQKHKTGYQTIQTYLERDYKTPVGFRNSIYISQLLQRDGMKIAIEAHRRNKPFCMGTLFWQLNDCWPGTSWSAVDYYQRPKAFFYALKELYKTQLISVSSAKDVLEIKCVSDSVRTHKAELILKILNFRSDLIWQRKIDLELTYSKVTGVSVKKEELPPFDTSACYLKSELISGGKILACNFYFFVKSKDLALPKTSINIVIKDSKTLEISSNFFSKDVYIYDEKGELNLGSNYFNLEAGEKKKVCIDQNKKNVNPGQLKVICLNNL